MIFRLSHKLGSKIDAGSLATRSLDPDPWADWSGHLFVVDRTQYIILSHTTTLYSCCMYGAGIRNDSQFIGRALSTIREFMQDDGQLSAYEEFIAPASQTVHFAKALDRKTTGSLNELIQAADHVLVDGEISPHDVGFQINGLLLSALASAGFGGYGKPKDAFRKLIDASR